MATKYISPTGNDSTGNGSYALPYLTTTKAIAETTGGDIIIFKNGTYTWTVANYSFNAARTFQAETNGSVILDAGGASLNVPVAGANLTTVLTGFIFQNVTKTSDPYAVLGVEAYISGFSITFNNCIFRNSVLNGSANYTVGGWFGHLGAWNAGSTGTFNFNYCLIHGNTWSGATGKPYLFAAVCYGNGTTWNLNVIGCVFLMESSAQSGIFIFASGGGGGTPTLNMVSRNNIFYSSDSGTLLTVSSATKVLDNDYNCARNLTLSSYVQGAHDLTSDPLFVDAANSDFRLRPTSPCIGTGTLI